MSIRDLFSGTKKMDGIKADTPEFNPKKADKALLCTEVGMFIGTSDLAGGTLAFYSRKDGSGLWDTSPRSSSAGFGDEWVYHESSMGRLDVSDEWRRFASERTKALLLSLPTPEPPSSGVAVREGVAAMPEAVQGEPDGPDREIQLSVATAPTPTAGLPRAVLLPDAGIKSEPSALVFRPEPPSHEAVFQATPAAVLPGMPPVQAPYVPVPPATPDTQTQPTWMPPEVPEEEVGYPEPMSQMADDLDVFPESWDVASPADLPGIESSEA